MRIRRKIVNVLLLGVAGSFMAAGCRTEHRVVVRERTTVASPGDVVISTAPPAPQEEVIGAPPSAEHVWVAGYWAYQGTKYVWVPGHWELRPRPGVIWVQGHWRDTRHGWVWTPGHWK
jgi:hypothetical protein